MKIISVPLVMIGLLSAIMMSSCTNKTLSPSTSPTPQTTTSQAPAKEITVARCVGYCNLPLFLAADNNSGAKIRLKYIANPGDHATALLSPGGPQASVTPFTNVLTASGNGKPVRIIAGSGMNGLAIVGRPNIKSIKDLAGKRIATFRADTLEVFAYDAVKQANLQGKVKFVYFADALEPITALKQGDVDAITHVEPFVSQLISQNKMTLLARGETLWKTNHPDCVLMTTVDNLKSRRAELKILILKMLEAQLRVEENVDKVASEVAKPYYQMEPKDFIVATKSQFPQIDIRDKKSIVLEKGNALVNLGYIRKAPADDIFDFSLLDEVVKENPGLLAKLRHKSLNINK